VRRERQHEVRGLPPVALGSLTLGPAPGAAEYDVMLSYFAAEARRNGAQLPVTALVDQFYAEVQKLGGARWDTSSLLARLK
jgi:3-hydroxyisobutyrate dehydrogenase-like beta-hydroxyacid dehydrogenase